MPGLNSLNSADIPANTPYWIEAFGLLTSFSSKPGQAVTVNYALKTTGSTLGSDAYRALTAGEISNIESSLGKIAQNSGISFVETTVAQADLLIGASSTDNGNVYGRTWPRTAEPVQVVAYDSVYSSETGLANNGYIYVHELMHAVGLLHSTRAFGSTRSVVIPDDEDNGTTLFGSWSSGWDGGIQLFDLAVMQFLYGPDTTQRTGNDTYTPPTGAYNPASPGTTVPLIWDGGGRDTIDLSGAGGGAVASLAPGFVSRVNTTNTKILEAGTFSINHGTRIEKLIGTDFNDTLRGSARPDTILGRGGQDKLVGGNKQDRLNGGNGNDRLIGQDGRDKLVGGRGDDRMTGGKNPDQFIFEGNRKSGTDRITDFQPGRDILKFLDDVSRSDITLRETDTALRVIWDAGEVRLLETERSDVSWSDFVFV